MVVRATKEGKLSYNEAYRLTGLKGKTFSDLLIALVLEAAYEKVLIDANVFIEAYKRYYSFDIVPAFGML